VVCLSGGVGGAKLAEGLARALGSERDLTVIVNTGDDFQHLGLWISPDLDTVVYTLAGLAHTGRGFGLEGDTFRALEALGRLGGPTWFGLGDADLATHLVRSARLLTGGTLTEVTAEIARALGVEARVLPMCDRPRATRILTRDEGELEFQEWLVRRGGRPPVAAVRWVGETRAAEVVLAALEEAALIVVGPSNPYVSIDPILGLEGVRQRVGARPTVAVSPLIGGRAVKGPLASMIPELEGLPASHGAVAAHYGELVDLWIVPPGEDVAGHRAAVTDTWMRSAEDRLRVARAVLEAAEGLA
jgi:LPPG:FO 2-phospho-L-lactate transferase